MGEQEAINGRSEQDKGKENVGMPMDLSAMINKLISNPQLLTGIASALSGDGGEQNGQKLTKEAAQGAAQSTEQTANNNAESVGYEGIDIDAITRKLPEIMGVIAPVMSRTAGGDGKSESKKRACDNRSCLLNAMKPYMNPQRCEAIDYIIKFSQISEILKNIT